MNYKQSLAAFSFLAGSFVSLVAAPAKAFTPFTFTNDVTYTSATEDIWLNSVTLSSGKTVNQFNLVTGARIVSNDNHSGGNTGSASADIGDNATTGVKDEDLDPANPGDEANVVTNMGNLNLNNIIDNEDDPRTGSVIDLFFNQASDHFFFWERGANSDLQVDALDESGNVIAGLTYTILRDTWADVNEAFRMDTTEVSNQKVGSLGLKLGQKVSGIRLTAATGFNGPDYKVVAADVPEPATLAGLALVGGALGVTRRRQGKKA